MASPELGPDSEVELRTEEHYLITAGFGQFLDLELSSGVKLRNFLDAYPDGSPHRDKTEGKMYQWLNPDENLDAAQLAIHDQLGEELRAAIRHQILEVMPDAEI